MRRVTAEPLGVEEFVSRMILHRTAMHNVLVEADILPDTRHYQQCMHVNVNLFLDILKDEEESRMKKKVEADFCDGCESQIVHPFWSSDDVHLCKTCAKEVLKRIGNKAIKRAIQGTYIKDEGK